MRAAAIAAAALALAAGCTGEGSPRAGALPACAAKLPVPHNVEVVEVTATPTAENPTCAVILASDDPVDEVVASVTGALERAGVDHDVQHEQGRQAVFRLNGPVCGSVLVFAAGTERITDAVPSDRTPVLASVAACADR